MSYLLVDGLKLSTKGKKKLKSSWPGSLESFACEKVFDFAVDTSKALQWNQPAAAENSS